MCKKIILIFLFIFSLNLPATTSKDLNSELKQFRLKISEGDEFAVIKSKSRSGKKTKFFSIIAEKGKSRIDLEVTLPVAEKDVSYIIDTQLDLIEKLYGPQFTPYQGAVTNLASCTEKYLPKKIFIKTLGRSTTALLVNSTERFVLGVCDKNEIKMKAIVTYVYHPSMKALMNFRIFSPVAGFSEKEVINLLENMTID